MNEEIKQLKIQVEELTKKVNSLYSSTSIPFDVGEAFKVRILGNTSLSPIPASTHYKEVHENGTDTYDVMNIPTGYVILTIKDTDYVIPYF